MLASVPFLDTKLAWLPLVKMLLGAGIANFAPLFAFVVGMTLTLAMVATVMVFYRPIMGSAILTVTWIAIYIIAFFESV